MVIIRHLGQQFYSPIYQAMRDFTDTRNEITDDEIWVLEHFPVYTMGMRKNWDNLLNTGNIPVVETDRGGQVTYHGLGQLIIYVLIDMKRRNYNVKNIVYRLEQAVIEYLINLNLKAHRREQSPGVYVDQRKISALGLRMRRGCIYHGLSLNVDMDLSPFIGIYPCGDKNAKVTQLRDVGLNNAVSEVAYGLIPYLLRHLDYSETSVVED
jgi:lipoyl(octanoyl) transferase